MPCSSRVRNENRSPTSVVLKRNDFCIPGGYFIEEPARIPARMDRLVWTSVRRLARLFSMPLALLSVALFTPATARAGCDSPTHIERNPQTKPTDVSSTRKLPSDPAKPCPCTGPTCTRRPVAPPATPVPLERVTSQDWGCPLLRSSLAPSSWTFALEEADFGDPVRRGSSIFHPPRAFGRIASL